MSILDRLEEIRIQERLNKGQFEKLIGKSSGYVGTLKKTGSVPGVDVIIKISKNFPAYNLQWLLTGEGEMLTTKGQENEVKEGDTAYASQDNQLKTEVFKEVEAMRAEMNKNFGAINEALVLILKSDHKIQRFVEGMNEAEIQETAKQLQEYLKDKQEK